MNLGSISVALLPALDSVHGNARMQALGSRLRSTHSLSPRAEGRLIVIHSVASQRETELVLVTNEVRA